MAKNKSPFRASVINSLEVNPAHKPVESINSSTNATASTSTSSGVVDWPSALASLEERHTSALAALEKRHGDRLAQIEERLAAAERAHADLGGQIKEMR